MDNDLASPELWEETDMFVGDTLKMRKAALAGAVALALTGTGAALAWSATGTPTPSPSQSATGQEKAPGKATAPGQQDKQDKKAQRPQPLHGEGVVKNPDGTFQTKLEQRGTVESVSDSAITIKSEDGFSQTYTVNGDTKITVIPAPAADGSGTSGSGTNGPNATSDGGKRLKPADGTIADIAVGDTVRISGVKDGEKATAGRVVKGAGDGPGLGLGRGLGRGHGLGHKMGQGNHQDDDGA